MSQPTIYSERMFAAFEEDLGACADTLGIGRQIFRQPDVELSIDTYYRLLDCAARSSNPHIGHSIGAGMLAGDLGPLGHAAAAAADVREMLATFSRYLYVLAHANVLRVDLGKTHFAIAYDVTDHNTALHQQDVELALSYLVTQLRCQTGHDINPQMVDLQHSTPPYAKTLRSFFGCETRFDRGGNRLYYARRILDMPLRGADPSLFHALESFLAERLKLRAEDADLDRKVMHLVATSLHRGLPDVGYIAGMLGLSARTLQRRLRERELVFSDMVETTRRDIAAQYVRHSEVSLTEIALMLGYSELSAFSRAFKRWTGTSPQQARASEGNSLELRSPAR